MTNIGDRKSDHLELAASGNVGYRRSSLLECVELIHDALPELDLSAIDTGVAWLGKPLRMPIVIAAMTGGTERATRINRELAQLAAERGYAMGLGSQRPMLLDDAATVSYLVRDVAPGLLLLGNIGAVQAARLATARVQQLVDRIEADALCVHLNPAMELAQAEGDSEFSGILPAIERLVDELDVPVVVKETGCGLSASVARRLRDVGVRHVDVSGAGGTSWVAVESLRAAGGRAGIGETFREWGIPTAASVALCAQCGFCGLVASGGVNSGLDIARALALGATLAGIARPVLQALQNGGLTQVHAYFDRVEAELRAAMLLVGARTLGALANVPRVIHGDLERWLKTCS